MDSADDSKTSADKRPKTESASTLVSWIARRLILFGAVGLLGVMLVSLIFYLFNGMGG